MEPLSVSALLDLFEIGGEDRRRIESCHRPAAVQIHHKDHGTVIIRDQIPLPPQALKKSLNGMTPEEWYRLLNGKAFFWVTEDRVRTLLKARQYRERPHCVLTVETTRLVDRYQDKITLCPVNSGCVLPNPRAFRRGRDTFLPMSDYPFEESRKKRGSVKKAIAELTVPYAVPDIMEMVVRTEMRQGEEILEQLFPSNGEDFNRARP